MMAAVPSCMPNVECDDYSVAFVTEYHYLHSGRPPALLRLLCHISENGSKTQLASYNGGAYHGPWSICGSVLNVAFHWKANEFNMKDVSFIEGPKGQLQGLPPCHMIFLKPSRSWSSDGISFEEVLTQPEDSQPEDSQWDMTKTSAV